MIERWRDISLEPRLGPVVGVLVSFYPGHFHWRHTLALIVAGGGDTYISVTRRQFGQIDGGLSETSLSRSASPINIILASSQSFSVQANVTSYLDWRCVVVRLLIFNINSVLVFQSTRSSSNQHIPPATVTIHQASGRLCQK